VFSARDAAAGAPEGGTGIWFAPATAVPAGALLAGLGELLPAPGAEAFGFDGGGLATPEPEFPWNATTAPAPAAAARTATARNGRTRERLRGLGGVGGGP
jgi:hypothetical protein